MVVNDKDAAYFINLKSEDININMLTDLFGDSYNAENKKVSKSKFNTTDIISLKAGDCMSKAAIKTTLGRVIYNKIIIQPAFGGQFGYINEIINKKGISKLEETLAQALMNDTITVEQMFKYLDNTQWLGANFNHVLTPSFTLKTLKPIKKITDDRDMLLKKNKDRIDSGDVATAVSIENKLIKDAKELLKDDIGMDLFNSGARGSFENNYKNTSIMKGTTYNPISGKFEVIGTSLIEGVGKEHMHLQGNSIISGSYPKAIGTADSGYLFKQLVSTFQTVTLDVKGSDCGSKSTIQVNITSGNIDKFMYRYAKIGNGYVILTPEVIKKYIGKDIDLRSPMHCVSSKLCNVCAGDIFYKMNIEHVGLLTSQISSDMLNASMKQFHDSSQKLNEINIGTMFI